MPAFPRLGPRTRLGAALALGLALLAPPAAAQAPGPGDSGAYLSSREAVLNRDFPAALPYLERQIATAPDNLPIREQLVISLMALGEMDRAADVAEPLVAAVPDNGVGNLALTAAAFARGDFAAVIALHERGADGNPLVEALTLAWAQLGQGRMTEALAALDDVSGATGLGPFALYCRALMLALAGDAEGALAILEDPDNGVRPALNRRGVLAHIQLLGLTERFDDALAMIDDEFGGANDPHLRRLAAAFGDRRSLPFDLISGPADGMAEVYAVLAAAIRNPQGAQDTLIYAQAALAINPRLSDARIILGQVFEELGQTELAEQAFAAVPEDDGFALIATLGRAQTLDALDRGDEAIAILRNAVAQNPESQIAATLLGDYLRQGGDHAGAIAAYTLALEALAARGQTPDWRLWFSRAVAHERSGQWPEAEADFRSALELEPGQPTVLNYLGYSLVERREKLDEALGMIERAVQGEPDSGYITDSLAWALFRLGRYEEAVAPMERAVALMPTDPVLNDHLGDVYWAVGREREAQFQWRRALSFGPHDDMDSDRLRRKLEVGLDQVLSEEGAEPLRPAR